MSCAMQIVQSLAPHSLTCQDIELSAAGATGELTELHLYMALQHQRVDMALFLGQRTEGDSTRDVRRTVLVLCATVKQQQALRLQGYVRLGRCLVVNNGAMFAVSCYRVE